MSIAEYYRAFRSAISGHSTSSRDAGSFPPEFDPATYRRRNPALALLGERQLRDHYEKVGRGEGRIATTAVPRHNFLKLLPRNRNRIVLEIGPFAKPSAKGPNVKYFDVMDRVGLVKRAEAIPEPTENIPEIDFVSPVGDLSVVDIKASAVLSSHCIEHQPDLVRHLQQVEHILEEDGCYFVIVPDKRYCFDHYLPESTIAEVLEAHHEKRTIHTCANVVAHYALTTHNDPAKHWKGDNGPVPRDSERVAHAIKAFEAANGAYLDVHSLIFTPHSFREILATLFAMKLTKLRPVRVYDTPEGWNEFCAILQKSS